MNRRTINVIIGIVFAFFLIFFVGSFAYQQYTINKSDSEYEESLNKDLDETSKENQSGQTNEESKNNW